MRVQADKILIFSFFEPASFDCRDFTYAFIALSASGLSKDSLPGPYPKTPEERAAAAKKYNMRVEDYEPYPDNGEGWALILTSLMIVVVTAFAGTANVDGENDCPVHSFL